MGMGLVVAGKGGSNDPFLYTIVEGMVSEDGNIIASSSLVDPVTVLLVTNLNSYITQAQHHRLIEPRRPGD